MILGTLVEAVNNEWLIPKKRGWLNQAPVVQGMDSKIERINRYAVDK